MASGHRHEPYPSSATRSLRSSSKTPRNTQAGPSSSTNSEGRTAVDLNPDTERVTIDPRGDVILALKWEDDDTEKEEETPTNIELRVSSSVLSLASPVFSAMFSHRFSEGQALQASVLQGESLRIVLPEDRPSAIKLLCLLLHHKYVATSVPPSQELLCQLGVLCQKYDCVNTYVIQRAVDSWLEPLNFESDECHDDLLRHLIIVSLFENSKVFKRISTSVVLCMDHRTFRTNFMRVIVEGGYEVELPSGFFTAFSDAKIDVLETLHEGLYRIAGCFVGSRPPKRCQLHALYNWVSDVHRSNVRGLDQPSGRTSWKKPCEILRWLEHLPQVSTAPESMCSVEGHRCDPTTAHDTIARVCRLVRHVAEQMCLECIKSESNCSTCTHR